jgi:hypothetical protein
MRFLLPPRGLILEILKVQEVNCFNASLSTLTTGSCAWRKTQWNKKQGRMCCTHCDKYCSVVLFARLMSTYRMSLHGPKISRVRSSVKLSPVPGFQFPKTLNNYNVRISFINYSKFYTLFVQSIWKRMHNGEVPFCAGHSGRKTFVVQEGNGTSLRQSPVLSCYKWL